SGSPRFPSRSDCARPPVAGQPVAIVYGRFERLDDAQALLTKLASVGFKGVVAESDGCGRVVVRFPNAPSVDVGQSIVDEARGATGDTRATRPAADEERQAGNLLPREACDNGEPRVGELCRRRRAAPTGDAVGLLDEGDGDPQSARLLARSDEIGSADAPA